jgi:hypothetical protein
VIRVTLALSAELLEVFAIEASLGVTVQSLDASVARLDS